MWIANVIYSFDISSNYIIREYYWEFVAPVNVFVSYMALYKFREIFSTSIENEI